MKRTSRLAMKAIAGSVLVLLVSGCGKNDEPRTVDLPAPPGGTSMTQEEAPQPAVGTTQTTCPVMGGKINKSIYADYKGRRVYFCCAGCKDTFATDPETYIKKLDEQLGKATPEASAGEQGGEATEGAEPQPANE